MNRTPLVLVILLIACSCDGGTVKLASEGTIAADLLAPTLEFDASLAASYEGEALSATASLGLDETGLQAASFRASLSGAGWMLTGELALRATSSWELEGTLALALDLAPLGLDANVLRQVGGVGLMLTLTAPESSGLRALAVGLNVDAFGRIQKDTCDLAFAYAKADLGFAWGCADVEATATLLDTGFDELVVRVANVAQLPLGAQLGFGVRYRVDDKTTFITPSISSESPDCVELYTGLVWDEASSTLGGLALYGLGLACELDGVRVRGLWELDSTAISLVKEPFWALLGLVWDVPGCCGESGEGSVAFFFGSDGLFDVGEAEFALEWPTAPGLVLSLTITLEASGGAQLAFGWEAEI